MAEQLITSRSMGSYNRVAVAISKWQDNTAVELNDIVDTLEIIYWWYSSQLRYNNQSFLNIKTNMRSLLNAYNKQL